MQNNKLTPILFNINVETGILSTSYRKMCVIYSALSSHPLIFIAQSTTCVILVQFDQINHELLCTFVFKTTVSYGVIIPCYIVSAFCAHKHFWANWGFGGWVTS